MKFGAVACGTKPNICPCPLRLAPGLGVAGVIGIVAGRLREGVLRRLGGAESYRIETFTPDAFGPVARSDSVR